MGHVDNAHHTEGDGQSNSREQQYRAQRDTKPDVLGNIPRSLIAGQPFKGGGNGGLHFGWCACLRGGQHVECVTPANGAHCRHRGLPVLQRCVGRFKNDGSPGLSHDTLDVGAGFGGDRAIEQFEVVGIRIAQDGLRSSEADIIFLAEQGHLTDGGAQRAAQAVVHLYLVELDVRQGWQFFAGDRIGANTFATRLRSEDGLAGGFINIKFAFKQNPKDRDGTGITAGNKRIDCGGAVLETARCQGIDQRCQLGVSDLRLCA